MNLDVQLILEAYRQITTEDTLSSETMNVEQLKDYLMRIKGTTAVYVELEAPLKMNKKAVVNNEVKENPYLGTIKHTIINGMAGGDYELAVQNKELSANEADPNYMPSFKSEPIWHGKGQRVSPLLVQHTDTKEYYLVIGSPKTGSSTYTFKGQPIDKTELEPWIPKPSISQKQTALGIKPEDQQKIRYPSLKNIKKIKINNIDIQVI